MPLVFRLVKLSKLLLFSDANSSSSSSLEEEDSSFSNIFGVLAKISALSDFD